MIKISVIMPVYNSEQYLDSAIKSVLNQSLEDIELLLVDDGSTDNSGVICDRYAKEDKRVRVIHKNNEGITPTRNRGIDHAEGEYFTFMDNDDILKEDILRNAYEAAVKEDADIVKYGYEVQESFSDGFVEYRETKARERLRVSSHQLGEAFSKVRQSGYFNMVWNGIYKKSFMIQNHIAFDETVIRGYEDWIFNFHCYPKAGAIILLPETGYIHFQRQEHSTSKTFHKNQLEAIIKAAKAERDMYREIGRKLENSAEWQARVCEYLIEFLLLFERKNCDLSRKNKKYIIGNLKQQEVFHYLINTDRNKGLPLTKKAVVFLFHNSHYSLLLLLSKIYYRYILYKKMRKQRKKCKR